MCQVGFVDIVQDVVPEPGQDKAPEGVEHEARLLQEQEEEHCKAADQQSLCTHLEQAGGRPFTVCQLPSHRTDVHVPGGACSLGSYTKHI